MTQSLARLVKEIRSCTLCTEYLPLGPRPIIQVSSTAKILIVGQAPGSRVHETGIPFNDPSGDRLREWMGIDKEIFYDDKEIALVPMGFCFPGTGKSGDLPPRPECAATWRVQLLEQLPNIKLTIVVGQYAQAWHLDQGNKANLTETVVAWKSYWPKAIPLPHPSPRNNIWLKKNPWFEEEVLPSLRRKVKAVLK
ncbi:uracil-DNA glycosylase [Jezberella montanilacus]|jgi:uracil-DNA glycosylase|uniref:Uracil-DNA glycosylase n=1 Tax=Jezberella montanilacus TaxID=323426 RepID=A0A2T0XBM4_9BURK|nr:uracil-DNA glycosylase family protein [Jezberella montanilacus]PRY96350.1 uracil-DNA glycosylase [Jezberella montanilacus]